jgi:transposase
MRKIREILRLRFEQKHSYAEIAGSVFLGRTTVADCLRKFEASGLTWPLPESLSDFDLDGMLYRNGALRASSRTMPEFAEMHMELRRKGVTKQLLWTEYKQSHPNGYEYTQFCNLYNRWKNSADVVFRNEHVAGEKCFIDYAGQTVPVHDAATGTVSHAQIFVAVLGASSYTYAEATWTQCLADWISSHNRAFAFFGGVSAIPVPDNLKSAVTKPCRYDPVINPTYYELARHNGAAVIPARVKKPRDKAKAEAGVLLVERWILAALRKQKFFSLAELNKAIAVLLEKLNNKPFKKLSGCRRSAFELLDKPALKPLPATPYQLSQYKDAKVNINYHVSLDEHFYSVPYQLVQKTVTIRYTANTVEILHGNKRVASHQRSHKKYGYSTLTEHMPAKHSEYAKWTPERMGQWAGEAGPSARQVAETLMTERLHPQQGFNSVLGIIRLGEKYGKDRLERACAKALHIKSISLKTVRTILSTGMDNIPIDHGKNPEKERPIDHENIRGPSYYN